MRNAPKRQIVQVMPVSAVCTFHPRAGRNGPALEFVTRLARLVRSRNPHTMLLMTHIGGTLSGSLAISSRYPDLGNLLSVYGEMTSDPEFIAMASTQSADPVLESRPSFISGTPLTEFDGPSFAATPGAPPRYVIITAAAATPAVIGQMASSQALFRRHGIDSGSVLWQSPGPRPPLVSSMAVFADAAEVTTKLATLQADPEMHALLADTPVVGRWISQELPF